LIAPAELPKLDRKDSVWRRRAAADTNHRSEGARVE